MEKIKVVIAYFTTESKNTENLVGKLNYDKHRIIPDVALEINTPFVLFFPTYGGGKVKGAIPKAVIDFIKNPINQKNIIGIVGSGDRNYGADYCLGAKLLSEKLKVPLLYKYEIRGTNEDIYKINEGIAAIQKSINENNVNLGE